MPHIRNPANLHTYTQDKGNPVYLACPVGKEEAYGPTLGIDAFSHASIQKRKHRVLCGCLLGVKEVTKTFSFSEVQGGGLALSVGAG